MAQSYSNLGGSGLRRDRLIVVTTSATYAGSNSPPQMLDGNTANNTLFFFNGATTYDMIFDFGSARIIDEFKWYQSTSSTHGTWKFQGSNTSNTGPWTDIGSNFTLGGASPQTVTAINGNTTPYRYFKLVQVSGTTSNSPFINEIEFKIDDGYPTGVQTYMHAKGAGDRTASVTFTTDVAPSSGTLNGAIDGLATGGFSMNTGMTTFKWDFGAVLPVIITECAWQTSNGTTMGVWQWAGSNDNASWTNIGSTFTLGGSVQPSMQLQTELSGNTTGYRYYRLTYVSGSRSAVPTTQEIFFKCKDGVAAATRRRQLRVAM